MRREREAVGGAGGEPADGLLNSRGVRGIRHFQLLRLGAFGNA